MYPEPLARLLAELAKLPSIGPRSAERLAFYLLKESKEDVLPLARAIEDVKERLRPCSRCGLVTEAPLCAICTSPSRDAGLVCVVEQPKDVYAFEKTGAFRGVYHVLMGAVALLEGVELSSLLLGPLLARIERGEVREVLIATNPTLEGDTTALALIERLRPYGVAMSRLARGVAHGGTIEKASRAMLEEALEERRPVG